MDEESKWYLAFSVFPGIGPVRFRLLLDYFGSAKKAFHATKSELQKIFLGEKLIERFISFRKSFSINDYIKQLSQNQITVLTCKNDRYPKLLKEISDAPIVLYIKGKKSTEGVWDISRSVAVVGTRQMTDYGKTICQKITSELVEDGITIISGMAWGIDAVAHESALENHGKTIAVLGSGIDIIAPPRNTRLYWQIIKSGQGAIVSEMPLGLRPNKGLFPARNRIISGMSLGTVIIEGAEDSGALITARYAAEQGREVFAVPGPVTSRTSRGPSKLLKSGATLIESAADIIEALGLGGKKHITAKKRILGDNEFEQKILDSLANSSLSLDEVSRITNLTISIVLANITILEMKGMVRDIGDKVYTIN